MTEVRHKIGSRSSLEVRQGCVISGLLFLLALDWIMIKTTAETARRGIRWNYASVLEDLDFVDDIALPSFKFDALSDKTGGLIEQTARVCLILRDP